MTALVTHVGCREVARFQTRNQLQHYAQAEMQRQQARTQLTRSNIPTAEKSNSNE